MKYILALVLLLNCHALTAVTKLELKRDYALHVYDKSYVDARSFDRYTDFHRIVKDRLGQEEMLLRLPAGTQNTYDPFGVRVEAFIPWAWSSNSENVWNSWQASVRIDELGTEGRGYALFQMKSTDPNVQWEVAINLDENGNIKLNNRVNDDKVILLDPKGKVFNIRVASNGRRYKVWLNGSLQTDTPHQKDPSGNSRYAWRWGIYKGGDTLCQETSKITFYNIAHGTSDSEGNLLQNIYDGTVISPFIPRSDVAKLILSCDNEYNIFVNGNHLGRGRKWTVANEYYSIVKEGTNVIEVEGIDKGGIAAMIADITVDSQKIVSDGSWEASLNRANWFPATEYGSYGITPWRKNISGIPSNTTAKWIWSYDNNLHNRVYFRYVFDLKDSPNDTTNIFINGIRL